VAAPGPSAPSNRDTVPMRRAPGPAAPPLAPARPEISTPPAPVRDPTKIVAWLCCDPLPPIPLGLKPLLSIGRTPECDLMLPHKEVSRRHASIKVRGKVLLLEDEGSSNGCYVNGSRASGQVLKVGDVLTIGPYELELRATDAAKPAGTSSDTDPALELTSIATLNRSAAMTGKLEDVPLSEVLQQIEFNKKTGTLTVEDKKTRGSLTLHEGAPLFARWKELADEAAVLAMLELKVGRFTFSGEVEPGERTLRTTITGLLLEASRRIDEAPAEDAPVDEDAPA
jgi:pSer/pThr/pTyr-binding forkhead associated (FHA) protein